MFKSVAFGGGGVRGGLLVGGIGALETLQGLTFPNGIYGCSVGSIVATAVAFQLSAAQIKTMFEDHFDLDKVIPSIRLTHLTDLTAKKGLFTMDLLEDTLVKSFDSFGIDLRSKQISDAPQKLYMLASNLTTHKPTLLTGNIPLLTAIKCSCCLPFVFQPQVLFNQVYVDGGLFTENLETIVPKETLVFHIGPMAETLLASELETLPFPSYAYRIYRSMRTVRPGSNVVWLQNNRISILQELTAEDKQELYKQGYSTTFRFLSKRLSQKVE